MSAGRVRVEGKPTTPEEIVGFSLLTSYGGNAILQVSR